VVGEVCGVFERATNEHPAFESYRQDRPGSRRYGGTHQLGGMGPSPLKEALSLASGTGTVDLPLSRLKLLGNVGDLDLFGTALVPTPDKAIRRGCRFARHRNIDPHGDKSDLSKDSDGANALKHS